MKSLKSIVLFVLFLLTACSVKDDPVEPVEKKLDGRWDLVIGGDPSLMGDMTIKTDDDGTLNGSIIFVDTDGNFPISGTFGDNKIDIVMFSADESDNIIRWEFTGTYDLDRGSMEGDVSVIYQDSGEVLFVGLPWSAARK